MGLGFRVFFSFRGMGLGFRVHRSSLLDFFCGLELSRVWYRAAFRVSDLLHKSVCKGLDTLRLWGLCWGSAQG